jgi:hypothetical protein
VAGIAVIPDQFPLLGVHRDHGLVPLLEPSDAAIDVPELGVAIGMVAPLLGLAIGREAIADLLEQARDGVMADVMAEGHQCFGQVASALGGPEQGCFGVPTGVGFEERVEVVEEFGVAIGEARPSGSWPAGALGGRFGPGMVEFGEAGSNGGAREPGRLGDGGGTPQPMAWASAAAQRRVTRSSMRGARA